MARTDWREVLSRALAAGYAAEERVQAARFVAVERASPLDDSSPVVRRYDNGGAGYEVEGMAFLRVGGNSAFGRWLMREAGSVLVEQRDWWATQVGRPARYRPLYPRRDTYRGGVGFAVPVRGYERSIAFARAAAAVINEAAPGANARVDTYID